MGGTEEVLIEGNHAGTYTTDKPEIATVTAEYESVAGGTVRKLGNLIELNSKSNGKYTGVLKTENGNNFIKIDENGNISNVTDVNDATIFEVTKSGSSYIIKVKDKNLYLGRSNNSLTTSSSSTSWFVGTGHDFYSGSSSYIYICYNNGWKYQSVTDNWGNCAKLFAVTENTTTKDQTKLTFTGHEAGTTTVTIAGVEYTINVVPAELGNAEKLYIDFWVTNHRIYPTNLNVVTTKSNDTNNARTYYEFSAADFYGIDGKALAEVIPGTGNYESITGIEALYWKTRYLPAAYRQTEAGWTNKSGYGTDTVTGNNGGVDIERIRYYGNKWEYKAVGVDGWTEFSGTTADETGNQIVAYYMLKTTVTKEVTTYITDWPDKQTDKFYGVAVDYCVKYESGGERNPNTFGSGANQNTQWFNCDGTQNSAAHNNGYSVLAADVANDWKGLRTTTSLTDWYRVINNIRAVETDNYDIYMVTVTPSASFNLNAQQCPTSITYNAENEKVIWAESEDTITTAGLTRHSEAKIGGAPNIDKLVIQQCSGMLVTYYVRAKETPDALKVHYVNQKNNEEFYSYNIIVAQGTVFPENPNFSNNTLHNYSVQNIEGKTETVLSDLKLIPKIAAQYRYSKFTCVEVKRIEGGKDFYLYYTFDYEVNFVVDFGLPITITPGKINPDMVGKAVKVDIQQKNVDYGTITIAANNLDFTYTLKKMIDGYDTIVATYSGSQGNSAAFNINIIPATTVYYEDSFVDFYDAGSSAKKTEFTKTGASDEMGVWYVEGDANTTAEQALSKLGDKAIYGYDPAAYNNSTTFSMGSAKKVTVNTNGQYAQAKFTFKGTGFDVISLTNSDSGAITVEVLKDGTTAKTKDGKNAFYLVNNYYGYKQEGEQWVVDPTATNTLYQIPVMKVSGLDYGTYTAVITVDYAKFFDNTNDNKYSFWLDAIRIYDPMGVDNETYTKDNEGFPQYIKLRDAVKAGATAALFIDGAAKATISEYKNFGPNNEVYLATGQAISFKLAGDLNKIASVQIGAKAPNGNAATLVVNNGEPKEIATATEMYYDITEAAKNGGQVTIANNTGNILSLTNLKITYSAKGSVSLAAMNAEEQTSAVMMVRAMFAPPAPTVFEPETFTVSLKNYKDVYVREYIKVTVTTSDDVKYITVGDKKISRYDDERVWGGFRKGFVKTGKRIWSYYVSFDTAGQQVISVVAYDADGLASEAVENTVNIKPRSAWRGKKSEWHI